ncbi:MAG: DUF1990 family protein [Pseudonocardia sp.]
MGLLRRFRPGATTSDGAVGRILVVVRWPLGILLVSWRYLWRTTPVHRDERPGGPDDMPPPLPPGTVDGRVQRATDGVGPLLHRRYAALAAGTRMTPEEVMRCFREDPNWSTPGDVAIFAKTRGEPECMEVGDEYVVRMPGPYNGPVRIVARDATSVRMATLRGHLEAGQIEFRARPADGGLRFEIESWARSGDRASDLLYNHLLLAKEIQLDLWLETCLTVVARTGGRLRGGVDVRTRRVDEAGLARNSAATDSAATDSAGNPGTAGTGRPPRTP